MKHDGSPHGSLRQLVEDRTLWPRIAMAAIGKRLERSLHRGHFGHAPVQVGNVQQRDALHVGAGAPAVLPQLRQGCDLDHAETQFARVTNEAQRVHFIRAVLALAGVGATNLRQRAEGFVVANHLRGHPQARGRRADSGRPSRRQAALARSAQVERVVLAGVSPFSSRTPLRVADIARRARRGNQLRQRYTHPHSRIAHRVVDLAGGAATSATNQESPRLSVAPAACIATSVPVDIAMPTAAGPALPQSRIRPTKRRGRL